jgi:ABC-2 type transport system permease protein
MRKVWPIIKREYLSRVRTKAFWIGTALFPLLMFAFAILPGLLAARTASAPEPVKIVDYTGDFFPLLEEAFHREQRNQQPLELIYPEGRSAEEMRRQLNDQVVAEGALGYVIVDQQAIESGELVLFARNPSTAIGADALPRALREAVTKYRLVRLGVPTEAVDTAIQRVSFDVRRATNDPRRDESGVAALLMSVGLAFFIYGALIIYGMYVLQGVLEEKSNRVVEVIVSSVKPFQLMTGKILGIGAVGLTQISVWVLSAAILTAPQVAAALAISSDLISPPEWQTLVFFPIFFLLGFFLFATMYAGIGSMFNSMEDAQQVAGVANLLLIVPMLFLMPVIKNPGGSLAVGLSLFPFFSPVLMFLRIATQTPPAWQIALSIGIMVATIIAMIWIVAKIYRVGILMYGKKPTLPEIARWIRYT